jgi:uncharacterized glyoxalase superfamily protein PhnB
LKQPDSVTATIDVAVDPGTAFKIFTEEIDAWWDRGPTNFYDGGRALAKRFEPGVGGRYLEVYDDATGDVFEIGRITVWEPGSRLVYRSSRDDTEVDVRFAAITGGTRVVLVQRIVPGGTVAYFLSGWNNILGWYGDWADRPAGQPALKDLPRVCTILYYKDVRAATEWLVRAFGLRARHRNQSELMLGDSVVMLRRLDGSSETPRELTHAMYCYVDDLEAHFARAQTASAAIVEAIHKHGDRSYIAEDLEGHRWTFAQARPTQRV